MKKRRKQTRRKVAPARVDSHSFVPPYLRPATGTVPVSQWRNACDSALQQSPPRKVNAAADVGAQRDSPVKDVVKLAPRRRRFMASSLQDPLPKSSPSKQVKRKRVASSRTLAASGQGRSSSSSSNNRRAKAKKFEYPIVGILKERVDEQSGRKQYLVRYSVSSTNKPERWQNKECIHEDILNYYRPIWQPGKEICPRCKRTTKDVDPDQVMVCGPHGEGEAGRDALEDETSGTDAAVYCNNFFHISCLHFTAEERERYGVLPNEDRAKRGDDVEHEQWLCSTCWERAFGTSNEDANAEANRDLDEFNRRVSDARKELKWGTAYQHAEERRTQARDSLIKRLTMDFARIGVETWGKENAKAMQAFEEINASHAAASSSSGSSSSKFKSVCLVELYAGLCTAQLVLCDHLGLEVSRCISVEADKVAKSVGKYHKMMKETWCQKTEYKMNTNEVNSEAFWMDTLNSWPDEPIIIAGGPPCQEHSAINARRKGTKSESGKFAFNLSVLQFSRDVSFFS